MTAEYQRSEDFVHRHVAGEHLLLALRRDRTAPMFMLTPTAAFVWDDLARWTALSALVERVVAHFDVSEEVASADVAGFLEQLQSLGAVSTRVTER
jgi:hypothetical protein